MVIHRDRSIRIILVTALFVTLVTVLPAALAAQVKLPAIIGDHMVLQQGQPVNVWGWAAKNEQVTVKLGGAERTTKASATDGKWLRLGGIPTYGISGVFIDPENNRAHGKDERVGVRDFYWGVDFYDRLIKALAQ